MGAAGTSQILHLGFTGTQIGMTLEQREAVYQCVRAMMPSTAHHGDCLGSDADFHAICKEIGIPLICHPPIEKKKRAYCKGFFRTRPAKPYLVRDHEIVDETGILVATPGQMEEILRSGTWATVRYAKKKMRKVFIYFPNGTSETFYP
jgi:hypothetical protein